MFLCETLYKSKKYKSTEYILQNRLMNKQMLVEEPLKTPPDVSRALQAQSETNAEREHTL